MRRTNLLRTIALNLMTFCTLLIAVNVTVITIYKVSRWFITDPRAKLPNYEDESWASQHFAELSTGMLSYESFIGWKRSEFHGETFNVDEQGRRLTQTNESGTADVFIFGGSIVWGTGLPDESTIPSEFSHLEPDFRVTNWGQSSYTAHQGLEVLMRLYVDGERPQIVIFLDGVNDVSTKCQRELNRFSHSLERDFREYINYGSQLGVVQLIYPVRLFIEKITKRINKYGGTPYDCSTSETKRNKVATSLIRDWEVAQLLVESWGGQFFGFLQPVAYLSKTRLGHIDINEHLGAEFRAVYPLIRDQIANRKNMFDISESLDQDAYLYIDFCHFSEPAGRYIAQAMQESMLSIQGKHVTQSK